MEVAASVPETCALPKKSPPVITGSVSACARGTRAVDSKSACLTDCYSIFSVEGFFILRYSDHEN
jgi:hypothetical protein